MATNNLDHYLVHWYYATGQGVWFDGGESQVKINNATYSFPSHATKVKCTVRPVSKKKEVNGKETPYWTGTDVTVEYLVSELPPNKLSAPSVEIDKYTLTAKIENIEDAKAESVEFEVYRGNTRISVGTTTVSTARASYTCQITPGEKYRVRCRAINYVGGSPVYGAWSPYSSEAQAVPGIPTGLIVTVESETSVKVSWTADPTATSYKVQYATNKLYFDASGEVKSTTVNTNYAIITGLETGHEWYFRVCGTNSKGDSAWSNIVTKIVGSKPAPPTTWSLTSTAVLGEPVILYWVHNTEDGSKQNEAQIELTINGKADIITIDYSKEEVPEDEIDKIYSYTVDLSKYPDGAEILWRVRTRGITFEYSDWSIQREINTYAPPVSSLELGNGGTLTHFPYDISVTAGPASQIAVSYHVRIIAEYSYYTQDQVGNDILVSAGDTVFSRIYAISDNKLSLQLMPQDVILENNQPYKVIVTVAMDSGLVSEVSDTFIVSWSDDIYNPDATIVVDTKNLYANIMPYCLDLDNNLISDVVLSVYRREFDGTFVEIGRDIENYGSISVTDPHPALDYARYRIVARNSSTNVVSFTDLPAFPVNEPGIVIQWDEEWTQFDYQEETAPEVPSWVGSMLKLPYNVDVSENTDIDTTMVEYIGRSHPVSYYGTQKGTSQKWSCVIPKSDKETIYALRRLMNYPGNVYVREENGNGYWANIKVSMNIKHLDVVIPVSLDVKQVEGDI